MNFIKYLFFGLSWGCTVFVLINIAVYYFMGGIFFEDSYENFISHAIGSIIVGIGCATPSIVYTSERLTFLQQVMVHFGIGLGTFFIVGFYLNWIPFNSVLSVSIIIILNILIFTFVWFLFYLDNKKEAEKLNEKIKNLPKI